jgi:acetylserotonin N-methyltransferase
MEGAAPILELLDGFRKSKVLFTFVSLGIPDLLSTTSNNTLEAIARHLSIEHTDGLRRLLDACVALGLTQRDAGRYSLSPSAQEYLPSTAPLSLAGYVAHSDRVVYPLFGQLEHSVRTGSSAWQPALGVDGKDIFSAIYPTAPAALQFMRGMHSFSRLSAPSVVAAFDLGCFTHLVDLGGATGGPPACPSHAWARAWGCRITRLACSPAPAPRPPPARPPAPPSHAAAAHGAG